MTQEEQWELMCSMNDERMTHDREIRRRESCERQAQELLTLQIKLQAARTTHWLMYMMFNPAPHPDCAAAIRARGQT